MMKRDRQQWNTSRYNCMTISAAKSSWVWVFDDLQGSMRRALFFRWIMLEIHAQQDTIIDFRSRSQNIEEICKNLVNSIFTIWHGISAKLLIKQPIVRRMHAWRVRKFNKLTERQCHWHFMLFLLID